MKIKNTLLIVFLAGSFSLSFAQEKKPDWRKLHYLSEEEMYMELDHLRSFYETDPPEGPVKNVAEFDEMQSVLIRYPFGIPMTLIKELADEIEVLTIVANAAEEQTVITQYTNNGVNLANCSFLYAPTNSHWTRDYGPWFIFDGNDQPGIVNFPYNRPRPNDDDIPIKVASYLDIELYGMNLIHTGGNYMTDGLGVSASTDLVEDENPALDKEDIDSLVYHYLGIDDYYLLADPLDDYIEHIDTWGKFLSPGKVLIGEVPETDDRYEDFEAVADFFKNTTSSWGKPYEVFRVYTPGGSPSTPYTNSLIANNRVFVPLSGSQWDDEALDSYEEAMPGYEIIGITYGSWYNTDALHCRAKGIADLGMLSIEHMPLLGTVAMQQEYEITAEIKAYSGEDIYDDSVFVYYSINGGGYQASPLSWESGDTWSGFITGPEGGDQVSYYLYAADESGRQAQHPYIGAPDPHEFAVFGAMSDELEFNPDTLKFLTAEDADEGLPLQIINMRNFTVEIEEITPEAGENSPFYWHVYELPEMPYEIEAKDTLTLLVLVALPLNMTGEMLYDTLGVTTAQETYRAILGADSDLISALPETPGSSPVTVYPNPFRDRLVFDLHLDRQEQVSLSVYDLSGRKVFSEQTWLEGGGHLVEWLVPAELPAGNYIYQLKLGTRNFSGKMILSRQ